MTSEHAGPSRIATLDGYTANELRLIASALSEAALAKQREAASRRWTGARFANIRAGLRRQAKEFGELAVLVYADSERAR